MLGLAFSHAMGGYAMLFVFAVCWCVSQRLGPANGCSWALVLGMLAMSRQWYYPWQVSVASHDLVEPWLGLTFYLWLGSGADHGRSVLLIMTSDVGHGWDLLLAIAWQWCWPWQVSDVNYD